MGPGLCQGCAFALLFSDICTAVMHNAFTRFETHKDVMDAQLGIRKKMGVGRWKEAMAGEPTPTSVCDMPYVNDAGVISIAQAARDGYDDDRDRVHSV